MLRADVSVSVCAVDVINFYCKQNLLELQNCVQYARAASESRAPPLWRGPFGWAMAGYILPLCSSVASVFL